MNNLKAQLKRKARALGAALVGFTDVERYREYFPDSPTIFHPDRIWPEAKSVIVLAVPMPLPMLETTPSINYQELYTTSNIMLDRIAYDLVLYLDARGYPAIWAPRDGYAELKYLVDRAMSSFSHVIAGYLAGLGTIGWNHMLLTEEYGPRVRLVSVLTAAELEPDLVLKKDLCLHCDWCRKACPVGALTGDRKAPFAKMDMNSCTVRHQELKEQGNWPCGICTKVCPVGRDRQRYNRTNLGWYREELEGNPENNVHIRAWNHVRAFGSKLRKGEPDI